MRAIGIGVMVAAMCAGAAGARAQETLPFHQGQWGLEADVGGAGGGLLHFVTARTALVLDVEASHFSFDDKSGASFPSERTGSSLGVALGVRRHRPIAPHVVGTFGAAFGATWYRDRYKFGGIVPSTDDDRRTQYGPAVSVGGQYLLTDHLSFGVAYTGRYAWGRETSKPSSGASIKSTNSFFSAGFSPLYVTLYF